MGLMMFAGGVPDVRVDEARKLILLKIVAELPDDFFDPDCWPSPGERNSAAECRADLVDAVEFLTIARQSKEVTEFILRGAGHNLLVTGGISNGEPPTDAYDLFNYVWHCEELYRQLEEWAIEDNAKKADECNGLTDAGKPETAAPGNDMIRQYVERKVDEWLNDGPEEIVRVLTFWAKKPSGITPRLELGDVRELLKELAEIYGDDEA
jgi:hypothetical protein